MYRMAKRVAGILNRLPIPGIGHIWITLDMPNLITANVRIRGTEHEIPLTIQRKR